MGDLNEPMLLGALPSIEAAFTICNVPLYTRGGINAAIDVLAAS